MNIKIEKASLKDLSAIQELNLELFIKEEKEYDSTLNLNWTKNKLGEKYFIDSITDKNACALIGKTDNKIIGYLIGWTYNRKNDCRNIGNQAEIHNMFVLPEYRNAKVGSYLIKRFTEWAKNKDIEIVMVSAYTHNEKGINFYKKNGFSDYTTHLEINLKK